MVIIYKKFIQSFKFYKIFNKNIYLNKKKIYIIYENILKKKQKKLKKISKK